MLWLVFYLILAAVGTDATSSGAGMGTPGTAGGSAQEAKHLLQSFSSLATSIPKLLAFRNGGRGRQDHGAAAIHHTITLSRSSFVAPSFITKKMFVKKKHFLGNNESKIQFWKNKHKRQHKIASPAPKKGTLGYALRVGLAGGIAGASGTILLFPIDTAKTLRQADPEKYRTVLAALRDACFSSSNNNGQWQWHLNRVYRGIVPSALGAIPSSALYFGAYETMKGVIQKVLLRVDKKGEDEDHHHRYRQRAAATTTKANSGESLLFASPPRHTRLLVHSLSAASGNVLSSAIFVPKEALKQQMQFLGHANLWQAATQLCRQKGRGGLFGLYSGYRATLLRNIPTAALRFTLYEEFKHMWLAAAADRGDDRSACAFDWRLFAAGAMAGVLASALMTPVDVIKTRLSTGTCPVAGGMLGCVQQVLKTQGLSGLYMGAGSRMFCSGAFSAIGFGVFEACKKRLGISDHLSPTCNTIHDNPAKNRVVVVPPMTLTAGNLDQHRYPLAQKTVFQPASSQRIELNMKML